MPLVGGQFGASIANMRIDYADNWPRRHLKAFRFNYGSSPFYDYLYPEIEQLISLRPEMLGELTASSVLLTHKFLKAKSEIDVSPDGKGEETQGDTRREPSAASHSLQLDHRKRQRPDAGATIVKLNMQPYRQNFTGFEKDLSTLDLLFNYGPAASGMIKERTELIDFSCESEKSE